MKIRSRPKAHLLVSELMVLTNAALAAWAKEHGVTLLHRTQDVAIPKEFSGIWQTPLEIARVVKALAPAVLETNPRPHAGLGEAMYAPSTSPLRRYPDMINETQIISLLRDGKPALEQGRARHPASPAQRASRRRRAGTALPAPLLEAALLQAAGRPLVARRHH